MVKVGIKIMGCRLNHAEAATMAGTLEYEGYSVVEDTAHCDVLILHTCTITAAAQTESLRLARTAKRKGVQAVIMSGCTTSVVDFNKLHAEGVDVVIEKKTGVLHEAGHPLASQVAQILVPALMARGSKTTLPRFASTRASVKVQDGCNFRCAYCIVPDARGEPWSRPMDLILDEVQGLVQNGFKEIVLTGVNVACWKTNAGQGLVDLVRATSQTEGLARIRLSSIAPKTAERTLVDFMAEAESRLCHTLHYPLQSGDAGVLKLMNRKYTPDEYSAAVEYAIERIPNLGLGADVITGFPGEDDAAFANTVRMVECYPFSNLHVFPYSERPGTPAATMGGVVPVHVRRERARELIAIGERKRESFAQSFVGKAVSVLVERVDDEGVGKGWSSEYIETQIRGLTCSDIGKLLTVSVASAVDGSLLCATS